MYYTKSEYHDLIVINAIKFGQDFTFRLSQSELKKSIDTKLKVIKARNVKTVYKTYIL